MGEHFSPYIYNKPGTFYFSRRIPKDVQGHFNTERIMCSLKTKALLRASRLAQRFNEDLEDEWWQIRRRNSETMFSRFLKANARPLAPSDFPSLSECTDICLKQKGTGKNKAFFHITDRAINTVIQLFFDKMPQAPSASWLWQNFDVNLW